MFTITEIRSRGFQTLREAIGNVEAGRFVALILREPFDCAVWRWLLPKEVSLEGRDTKAMALREGQGANTLANL